MDKSTPRDNPLRLGASSYRDNHRPGSMDSPPTRSEPYRHFLTSHHCMLHHPTTTTSNDNQKRYYNIIIPNNLHILPHHLTFAPPSNRHSRLIFHCSRDLWLSLAKRRRTTHKPTILFSTHPTEPQTPKKPTTTTATLDQLE